MIGYIKGKLTETAEGMAVVENNGIGYELNMSALSLNDIQATANEVTVYTRMIVREDDLRLFGFSRREERATFDLLLTVSGLGPKLALAVLSGLSPEALAGAVVTGDVGALKAVKGVGKKTAERIVLELKDKLSSDLSELPASPGVAATGGGGGMADDAVLALMTLGYAQKEAAAAVARVNPDGLTLEQLIFNALKNA